MNGISPDAINKNILEAYSRAYVKFGAN